MKKTFNLVATAATGLEAVVGREIRDLGIDCQVENGKVRFQGDVRTIAVTNLWLRAADRVKIIVGEFPARTFEELFQGVINLIGKIICHLEQNFQSQKRNVSNQNCIMSQVFKQLVKKQLLKNFKRFITVLMVFHCRKMVLNSKLKSLF